MALSRLYSMWSEMGRANHRRRSDHQSSLVACVSFKVRANQSTRQMGPHHHTLLSAKETVWMTISWYVLFPTSFKSRLLANGFDTSVPFQTNTSVPFLFYCISSCLFVLNVPESCGLFHSSPAFDRFSAFYDRQAQSSRKNINIERNV